MPLNQLIREDSLSLYGVLTAAIYLVTAIFYIKGPKVHSQVAREIFAWFFCLSLLFLFWKGYQQISRTDKPPVRSIVFFAAIFCLLAFLTFPFHSTDVFGYINRGWQQVHYGLNPYIYPLAEIPNWQQDPMFTEHWLYNPNPYGFLFTLVARLLAHIGNGNWLLTLALFKTLNVTAYAATGAIIWSAVRHLPKVKPATALYLFLWNPLILMHHIANGHNDILTGLMVLLAVYFAIAEKYLWIVPMLACATLLKFAPVLLIPPALIFIIKNKGWRVAALGCLIGLALFAVISFPYLRDWNELKLEDMRGNATLIDNSLHSLLIHIFENIARVFKALSPLHASVDMIIKNLLRGGFGIFLLYQWLKIPRAYTDRVLATKGLLILFALICIASSKFNAWYLGMILPIALLTDEDYWLRRLVVLISCTQLLSLTFFKQAYMLNYFAMIVVPAWMVYRQEMRKRRSASAYVGVDS